MANKKKEDAPKAKRGRPRKAVKVDEEKVAKKRGRPRKHPEVKVEVKRARGRPRKYQVIEQKVEKMQIGDKEYVVKEPQVNKVDSDYLTKHLLSYFTKIMLIHNQLAKQSGIAQPIFERLKTLDFQMAEVCKELLAHS